MTVDSIPKFFFSKRKSFGNQSTHLNCKLIDWFGFYMMRNFTERYFRTDFYTLLKTHDKKDLKT